MAEYVKGRLVARWGSWYGVPDAYHAVMPLLSGAAWKILTDLCYRSRAVDSLFPGHRALQISTGIESRDTIAAAIDELVVATVLTVTRREGSTHVYGLQLPIAPVKPDTEPMAQSTAQLALTGIEASAPRLSIEERLGRLARARKGRRERAKAKPQPTQAATAQPATPAAPAKPDVPANHPALKVWRNVTRRYPHRTLYPDIVAALGEHPNTDRLAEIFRLWVGAGYNGNAALKILDVYRYGWRNGVPPQLRQGERTPQAHKQDANRSVFDRALGRTSASGPEPIDVRPIHA